MLHPIFEEASNVVREEFPDLKQVVFARVDCDQHCEYFVPQYIIYFLMLPRKPNNIQIQVIVKFVTHNIIS